MKDIYFLLIAGFQPKNEERGRSIEKAGYGYRRIGIFVYVNPASSEMLLNPERHGALLSEELQDTIQYSLRAGNNFLEEKLFPFL